MCHFSFTTLPLSLFFYQSNFVTPPLPLKTCVTLSLLYSSIFVPLPLPLNMCHSFTSPLLLLLVFYLYSSMNLCHTSPTRNSAMSSSCKHVRNVFLSVFFCEINRFWWSDLSLSPAEPRFWKYAQENLFPVFIKCWFKKGFLLSFFFS